MKKFLLVFTVLVFIPCLNVHGQMAVLDAVVDALLTSSNLQQYIYFGQQIADNVTQIAQFAEQIEIMKTSAERQIQNLASIKDIDSWDDFMDFYNRQLYLERKTGEAWDNTNVRIGKKDYHITDIYGMKDGVNETYVEYWGNEFTEEQRKEMWLELGLTPANYAYVQPFREQANKHIQEGLTAVGIQNDWYMRSMQKNRERKAALDADKNKKTEDKLGSKEITMMILDTLLDLNKVTNDVAVNQAKERERQATQDALASAPNSPAKIADWSNNGFGELDPKK